MHFIIRVFLTVTLISLFASPAFADEAFSFKAGYLRLDPSGEIAGSVAGVAGTLIDLEDDLDIEDDSGYIIEAALQLGPFHLFAAYLPLNFSGDGVLSRDIAFNGETFVAGSRVESDVKIDIYEAGLAWFLVNIDDLPVRIQFGPEMSVKYIDASIELQDDTFGFHESEDVGVPVPSLGARVRVSIADYLSMVSRVGYLKYDGNSMMDVDAKIEFSPTPLVGLFAGYRYLEIDVDSNDVLIDATFSGPYAGAMVRF